MVLSGVEYGRVEPALGADLPDARRRLQAELAGSREARLERRGGDALAPYRKQNAQAIQSHAHADPRESRKRCDECCSLEERRILHPMRFASAMALMSGACSMDRTEATSSATWRRPLAAPPRTTQRAPACACSHCFRAGDAGLAREAAWLESLAEAVPPRVAERWGATLSDSTPVLLVLEATAGTGRGLGAT